MLPDIILDDNSDTSIFPVSTTLLIGRAKKVKFELNIIAGCQDSLKPVSLQSTTIDQTGQIRIEFNQRLVPLEQTYPLEKDSRAQ